MQPLESTEHPYSLPVVNEEEQGNYTSFLKYFKELYGFTLPNQAILNVGGENTCWKIDVYRPLIELALAENLNVALFSNELMEQEYSYLTVPQRPYTDRTKRKYTTFYYDNCNEENQAHNCLNEFKLALTTNNVVIIEDAYLFDSVDKDGWEMAKAIASRFNSPKPILIVINTEMYDFGPQPPFYPYFESIFYGFTVTTITVGAYDGKVKLIPNE